MAVREEIAIIDDEESVRELLSQIIAAEGFATRTYGGARDALSAILQSPPMAIFLDIRMPDMDGFQFLKELRKSHPSVPVIIVTGYADNEIFRQSLYQRVSDFLSKPFSQADVRGALKKVLGWDEDFAEHFLEAVTHRLREARLALGLKQAEVATRCGMSTSQVSQIELRQSAPSVPTLLKLCKALNLTMSQLVEGF
jgi:DNA-binding NtrC family response regulator